MSMLEKYKLYWGETHHNTYMEYQQDPPLDRILEFASTYLDFYTGAYYTPIRKYQQNSNNEDGISLRTETLKDKKKMAAEWKEFQRICSKINNSGNFIVFPGYEWQGNGHWGDHNVVYFEEGHPICMAETLPDLYTFLKNKKSIAIPHHTAYRVGQRAPHWSACNEKISPYSEIFSVHGCSETDEEHIGLRHNKAMGPGTGGGTYASALDHGLHLGAICSNDNWVNMPGQWGHGIMACLAETLTKESLWDAFSNRRVYGVTGDRIELDFTLNGHDMGSIVKYDSQREIKIEVSGSDAIDRIEVLKNNRVIATHCHQGTWDMPSSGQRSKYKIRIEPGWGPKPGTIQLDEQQWQGCMLLSDGRFIACEPCWVARGQTPARLMGNKASFGMKSYQKDYSLRCSSSNIFEFEAESDGELCIEVNGKECRKKVSVFAAASRILYYRNETAKLIEKVTGINPDELERDDVLYHFSAKVKIHKALPEAGYKAKFTICDNGELEKETHYRVRVEQRNGQKAWSSPIWVPPRRKPGK